jgi:hypothetical protein
MRRRKQRRRKRRRRRRKSLITFSCLLYHRIYFKHITPRTTQK